MGWGVTGKVRSTQSWVVRVLLNLDKVLADIEHGKNMTESIFYFSSDIFV